MRALLVVCTAIVMLSSMPATSQAEPEVTAAAPPSHHAVTVAVKGGIGLPQVSSAFGTAPLIQVEVGYLLPLLAGRLGLITGLTYSAPSLSGSAEDARLPGGTYTYDATQRQLSWELGVQGRLKPWRSPWNVGAATGLHLTFQSTLSDGEAGGESFGEHDERATLAGIFLTVHGAYRLGPGAVVGEAGYVASFQDLRTTGDLTLSEITFLAGYRLTFGL